MLALFAAPIGVWIRHQSVHSWSLLDIHLLIQGDGSYNALKHSGQHFRIWAGVCMLALALHVPITTKIQMGGEGRATSISLATRLGLVFYYSD